MLLLLLLIIINDNTRSEVFFNVDTRLHDSDTSILPIRHAVIRDIGMALHISQ